MSIHTPREIAHQRSISPQFDRLHALWCHGIVRARMSNRDFGALVQQGFATRRHAKHSRDRCDYIITARGTDRANELF